MLRTVSAICLLMIISSCNLKDKSKPQEVSENARFNFKTDLLLLNYDCKTDVDDLHSIAAMASLIKMPNFSKLNFHAVAGTYGTQDGKYVPANSLFNLAFGHSWSDAHNDINQALKDVFNIVNNVLSSGGNVWIAEAGQSDFSASLIAEIHKELNHINTKERIHIVQHSDWNEKVTSPEKLAFAKEHSNYHKIQDGNALNNGTPGFNTSDHLDYKMMLEDDELVLIWNLAVSLANTYNGVDDRYLNKSIEAGGLDFSDFSEVHYIFKLKEIDNSLDYFKFLKN